MNFDTIIDRKGTLSLKWDNAKNIPGLPDIIPLWVADMDFAPPDAVLEAIRARALHPIFGYTNVGSEYFEAVASWYRDRQALELPPGDILLAPSVMPSLSIAVNAFTERGEGVMILTPVYHPFFSTVEENGRVVVPTPLVKSADGSWGMDLAGMEAAADKAEKAGTRLRAILVSSPHNPVGRVWRQAEIDALLDFASRRSLAIFCDEIHSDIILGKSPFLSMARIEGERAKGLIVLSGPNKTFNMAGLHISQVIARDEATRNTMKRALSAAGYSQPNVFSLVAATAAYREGGKWLDELLAYLQGNYRFLLEFLSRELPEVGVSELEGSYLAWLDLHSVLLKRGEYSDERPLAAMLEEKGRVKLSPGSGFGATGAGYLRLNLACPRSLLAEGLKRMSETVKLREVSE